MNAFAALFRTWTRPRPTALGKEWSELASRLGLPPQAFDNIVRKGTLHPHLHYRHFTRAKRDGSHREIAEPDARLKQIQRHILARHLGEPSHPAAVAYQPKRSVADHVWAHAGAELFAVADVEDFFPSTSAARVEAWWRERVADAPARLLTLLTTYRGGLPQGAPTSPSLSNLVNLALDDCLARRAERAGATYTRYCDDLLFSWPQADGPAADFEAVVRVALHELGYRLHPRKGWRVFLRHDEPVVTGLILTRHGGVRLPDRLRAKMRELPRGDERLSGYRGYEAMIRRRPRK